MVARNTYVGDALYTWDLRLSRDVHMSERMKVNLAFDAFNLLNRPNVDEVTSVYGSPVPCGALPQRYNDAMTRAIQGQNLSTACPFGGIPVPGGSVAPTPIGTALFIPFNPNPNFGLPRTMFNARQLQFSVKFSF
jgi:hypothetical protein